MAKEARAQVRSEAGWTSAQAYMLAVFCLLLGVGIGYLFRGSASPDAHTVSASATGPGGAAQGLGSGQPQVNAAQQEEMIERAVAPLLATLKQSTLEPVPGKPGGASPGVTYSLTSYALCDKCHDVQGSILRDISFKHSEHVQSEGSACSTCHDPHAAPWPALVNFDLSIVGPNSTGQLSYINSGPGHGTCNLMCHVHDHVNASY